jgi:hypothetical protein
VCATPPALRATLKVKRGQRLRTALRRGLVVRATCSAACEFATTATVKGAKRRSLRGSVAKARTTIFVGTRTLRLRFTKPAARALRSAGAVRLTVRATAKAVGGTQQVKAGVRLRR